MKKICGILCITVFIMSVFFSGCTATLSDDTVDLMEGVTAGTVIVTEDKQDCAEKTYSFYFNLLHECMSSSSNYMISPLSVLYALSMTANGAKGNTLKQIEDAFGLDIDSLNDYLYQYSKMIEDGEELSAANSIWFRDENDFKPKNEFLQKNADYYSADIYKAPFDDQTVKDINNWVDDKTNHLIKDVISEIPAETIMYLINCLAFEGKWEEKYEAADVIDGKFTDIDSEKSDAEFMRSTESIYFEDDNCTGVEKLYKNGYSFRAFIPKEGTDFNSFAGTFDGEKYKNLLKTRRTSGVEVYTRIPKFSFDYDAELSAALAGLGITDIFDGTVADLSGLGECTISKYNLYVNKVIHKTHIDVDEEGTKAAAVTIVEVNKCTSAGPSSKETKYVYLDRPFMFMICDSLDNPVFVGSYLTE